MGSDSQFQHLHECHILGSNLVNLATVMIDFFAMPFSYLAGTGPQSASIQGT